MDILSCSLDQRHEFFEELSLGSWFDWESQTEVMGQCLIDVLKNVTLDQIENRKATETGKHCKVFVDVHINAVEILLWLVILFVLPFVSFGSWVGVFLLLRSELDLYEPFKIN